MNELKPLADRMGIGLYEVIRAAATKPFGFVPYYWGQVWVATTFLSIPFISPGRRVNMECTLVSLSWLVKSIRQCLLMLLKKQWMP